MVVGVCVGIGVGVATAVAVGVCVGIGVGVAVAAGVEVVGVGVAVGSGPEQAKAMTSRANMMVRDSLRVIATQYSSLNTADLDKLMLFTGQGPYSVAFSNCR